MFMPDRQAMLNEAGRVLVEGGILFFNVWDRIDDNHRAAANAEVVEALFPDDAEMQFRVSSMVLVKTAVYHASGTLMPYLSEDPPRCGDLFFLVHGCVI